MSSANMKGYYKQQKKTPATTTTTTKSKKPPIHTSNLPQPPSTVASRNTNQDEQNENEKMLQQFDMDMKYGPCIGMNRMERWERAVKFGMNPPEEIGKLLKNGKVQQESLWDTRI
ncbi:DNA polymerase delta subunit [Trifolium repens]|nr:DNA polymerase delta subunit [Trifolium repens]